MAQVNATVSYTRPELDKVTPLYKMIRDCLDGEVAVKAANTVYLPKPNPTDNSAENNERYKAYLTRAVFYNATRQTFAGLMGQVFTVPPLIEIPDALKLVVENVDGSHIDLTQLAKINVGYALPFGRGGILTDYSAPDGAISKKDLQSGKARATIKAYDPIDIINWRYETDDNNLRKLSLVVLREKYILKDTGFAFEEAIQYRELRLVDGIYKVTLHKVVEKGNVNTEETVTPLDFSGKPFTEIAFDFIGSENNTADLDQPPMYDIASLNISHYRNSADYEENIYLVGNPTVWASGLTEQWVKDVLGGGFKLGSRSAVLLPVGGAIGMVAAEENGIVKEALDHKERQMVAFGAKLVEQRSVQRTATEAGLEASAENSTLVSVVRNVSHAILKSLKRACQFMGIPDNTIKFELNTDFAISKLTPEQQSAIIKDWQAGAISWDEMRMGLRKGNIPLTDDKVAKAAIDTESSIKQAKEIAVAQANKPVNNFPPKAA